MNPCLLSLTASVIFYDLFRVWMQLFTALMC